MFRAWRSWLLRDLWRQLVSVTSPSQRQSGCSRRPRSCQLWTKWSVIHTSSSQNWRSTVIQKVPVTNHLKEYIDTKGILFNTPIETALPALSLIPLFTSCKIPIKATTKYVMMWYTCRYCDTGLFPTGKSRATFIHTTGRWPRRDGGSCY